MRLCACRPELAAERGDAVLRVCPAARLRNAPRTIPDGGGDDDDRAEPDGGDEPHAYAQLDVRRQYPYYPSTTIAPLPPLPHYHCCVPLPPT